jgi:hypothetical protein
MISVAGVAYLSLIYRDHGKRPVPRALQVKSIMEIEGQGPAVARPA